MIEFLRRHFNYTMPGKVGSARFRIPVSGGIEARGVHESLKTRLIRTYVDRGVFVDVGVNLGQTLLDLRASNPSIRYLGFEPNPRAVTYVQKLIEVNRLSDCSVLCAALGDAPGTLVLYSIPGLPADPGSTVIKNLRPHGLQTAAQPVAVLSYDSIAQQLDARPVGFVKVDVEGGELQVLRGMRQTLAADRPPVLCEVLPRSGGPTEADAARTRAELFQLVTSLSYTPYHVAVDGALARVQEFRGLPYDPAGSWDYLLLPAEQSPRTLR